MEKRKQKVLILVTLAEIGGAQMSVLNLARELKRRGVDVTVAFGKGEFLEEKCRRYSIPTHRFKHLNRSLKLAENFRFLAELRRFLKRERFTVLHINSSNALLGAISAFSLLRKRPRTVFTYRGLSFLDENFEANRFKKFFYIALFHILTLFVDREVFVSRSNFKSAQHLGLGRGGVVIYNGLPMMEVNFLEKNRAREKLEKLCGISLEKKMVVGSIGRLAYQKNYEFLIKNWKDVNSEVPEAVCVILGEGLDRAKLEEMIEREKIKESFYLAGEVTGASELIKGFDVFTLPSRYEGLSITTIEALFAGVPMLISKTGGNPEVLGSYEPFLFEVNSDEEFKEKLISLLTEDGWSEEALDLSRERAYSFGISETVNGYQSVYKNGKK